MHKTLYHLQSLINLQIQHDKRSLLDKHEKGEDQGLMIEALL